MTTRQGAIALALAAMPLGAVADDNAQTRLEELIVTARPDARTIDVTEALSPSPDPAQLLQAAPGANITRNGPITGIPQYRGLFGPRIAVALDGNQLAPAGPNWMDPPISYAVSAQLEVLEVYRGIAPVRIAPESLGGAIDARTRRVAFAGAGDVTIQGRAMASGQSVNHGHQVDAEIQASTSTQRVRAAFMEQGGDDAEFPGGTILPSGYERKRYDLGYGLRLGDHSFQVDYGHNDTGEAGTPALAMDIDYFTGDLLSASYRYTPGENFEVEARVYGSDLDHGMTNFHLRPPPPSGARWRQNIAVTENRGARLSFAYATDAGLWRGGVDAFTESHDSNIDNPNNPMFFLVNFNDAERDVLGAYLEHERDLGGAWRGEFGVRINRVRSDAGAVDGTPAMMPPGQALRDAFNNAERARRETNVDLVAKLHRRLNASTDLYAGFAQKQRGPSYQERYLWLPLEATAGLADGQVYVGNIGLDSERAHQFEAGADFRGAKLSLHPRLFYYRVDDYIQGSPVEPTDPAAVFVRMMNAMQGTNRAAPLQFQNLEAELYGFDMDWRLQLDSYWSLGGVVNYVRGRRRDVEDDLYRIAPLNASVSLAYASGPWQGAIETVAYAAQEAVSATNREQPTSGYATVNLRGSWQVTTGLQVALGVDNLFDREYAAHLGGYNRVRNPDIGLQERLPALGINVFGRVLYVF